MTKSCNCNHDEQLGARVVTMIDAVDRLRASMTHSSLAVALQAAEVRQVQTGAKDSIVSTSAGRLVGWALRETAGATATAYLRDGVDAGGDIIVPISLSANESTRDVYIPGGLSFGRGLYLDVVTGSVEGSVWLGGNGV
jgi:hypothetical protein